LKSFFNVTQSENRNKLGFSGSLSLPALRRAWSLAGLPVLLFASLLLRLYRLGVHDFWFDEVYSAAYAFSPWSHWNAPLYWDLLHFWIKIAGISEISLRLPSVLFGLLSTAAVFFLGEKLFNRKTAFLAAVLITLSPFQIWYAQEARDYGMVVFLGILSSYVLFTEAPRNRFRGWLAFSLVSLAGIYTNYFYIFLLAAQFLYVLCVFRSCAYKAFLSFSFVAGLFALYASRFLSRFLFVSKGFWVPIPGWRSLKILFQNYWVGYNGTAFLYGLSWFMTLFFLGALFFVIFRVREKRPGIIFCLFLLMLPLGAVFLFSKFFFPIFLPRGLLLFSPYFFLLIACAATALPRKIAITAVCISIATLCWGTKLYFEDRLYPLEEYHLGVYQKKPVRTIVRFLESQVGEGEIIVLTNVSLMPGIDFYAKRKVPLLHLFFPQIRGSIWERPVQETSVNIPVQKITEFEFKRMWVLSSDWGRTGKLDENSSKVKTWLDSHLKLISSRELDGLWIYCYERSSGESERRVIPGHSLKSVAAHEGKAFRE